jgi:hypothetical protein
MSFSLCSRADEVAVQPVKWTTGLYRSNGGEQAASAALDLNFRHTSGYGNAWLGWYAQPAAGNAGLAGESVDAERIRQSRAGWDKSFVIGAWRLQPSLQAADGGFVGGSLNVETGDRWTVGAGVGRTNLRPYVNLNFDPNDALMLSAGYRASGNAPGIVLQWVRDNRQNPDQRHLHLVYRQQLSAQVRLTIDLLDKVGTVDGVYVHKQGLGLTHDQDAYFCRLVYDPKANFGAQNMWRVSFGRRF